MQWCYRLCIALNPHCYVDCVDEQRFGYRMMQRMGWSKGSGLGLKEDGIKSFVKVHNKADVLGE